MLDEIKKHHEFQKANILRGFGINSEEELEIFKSEENDIEKAKHLPGDIHPKYPNYSWQERNGKWGWFVDPSKKKRGSKGGNNNTPKQPSTNILEKIQNFSKTDSNVSITPISEGRYPVIQISGNESQVIKTINKMNEKLGTNFSIDDFKREEEDEYGHDESEYSGTLNIHNNKIYKENRDAEADRPDAENSTSKYKKHQAKLDDDFKDDLDYVLNPVFSKVKYAYENADRKIKVGTQNDKGEIWMPTHNSANSGNGGLMGKWMSKEDIIKEAEIRRIRRGHSKLSKEIKNKYPKGQKLSDAGGREWTVTKVDSITGNIRFTLNKDGEKQHLNLKAREWPEALNDTNELKKVLSQKFKK